MPNYQAVENNRLIDSAGALLSLLSGDHLDAHRYVNITQTSPLRDLIFFRLCGYRASERQADSVRNKEIARSIASAMHSADTLLIYCVLVHKGDVGVYYGVPAHAAASLKATVHALYYEAVLDNSFPSRNELHAAGTHGGLITGIPHQGAIIDPFIQGALQVGSGILFLVASPIGDDLVQLALTQLHSIKQMYAPLSAITQTYGTASRRTMEAGVEPVRRLLARTDKLIHRLTDVHSGLFRTCVWCCAPSAEEASALASLFAGIYNDPAADMDGHSQRLRYTETDSTPFSAGQLYIPSGVLIRRELPLTLNSVLDAGLSSTLLAEDVAAFTAVPASALPGLRVFGSSTDSRYLHDPNAPTVSDGIRLGKVVGSESVYGIAPVDLWSHTLIAGINGFGKSNTVQVLLRNLRANDIPFLLIEPQKKEHWRLVADFPVRVFSAGEDASPLQFNPLHPVEGTEISYHIERMMLAFQSQSDMESPLPEALRMLLVQTYKDFGFDPNERADPDRRYPTLQDLLDRLDAFVTSTLVHSDRVKQDIRGALDVRLRTLLTGAPGAVLNTSAPLDFAALFGGSTIVELDDLTDGARNFTMNAFMCQVDRHLRNLPESNRLRRVLVLEEAHRFFLKSEQLLTLDSRTLVADYFSQLLSEIRGHGCGMVVVDQRPSMLNTNALANTAVKVLHALADRADVEAVSFHLGLSDYQAGLMRSMKRGEALVGVVGHTEVNQVQVDYSQHAEEKPLHACLFCKHHDACKYAQYTEVFAASSLQYQHRDLKIRPLRDGELQSMIEMIVRQPIVRALDGAPCCISGMLMRDIEISSARKRRIMYALQRKNAL